LTKSINPRINVRFPVINSVPSNKPADPARRSVAEALAPLDRLAQHSANLIAKHDARFEVDGQPYILPRYLFIGPKGGDDPIRVGLFAGIHGDEPEGVHALVQFVLALERKPELATGYCLFIYPICNPTGFEDNTRHARSGRDLNREFWTNSPQPEVNLLQTELSTHAFHGLISLHTDDTSEGFYGFVRGALLTKNLLDPALEAVGQVLPRNTNDTIDGFHAHDGIIRASYDGVLRSPPRIRPRPFEIILETPRTPAEYLKEAAFILALQTILTRYREFIAFAPNL
jgi:murein peptide amidase A